MDLAESLNLQCLCRTLDAQALPPEWTQARPHLFSATPTFISSRDWDAVRDSVAALHRVAQLPGYRRAALARADAIACHDFGPHGAFMGYDFHLSAQGPRLIEINTNAGGAFLQAAAIRAHHACCTPWDRMFAGPVDIDGIEREFMTMFEREWQDQRGQALLRTVAIVDDAPASQYLAPEFELARAMFERHGVHAVIADASELAWRDGGLWHQGVRIDLVYNRLTDFALAQPVHAALRSAYEGGSVVLTPNPRAHALHADKRNLAVLGDAAQLTAWGATPDDAQRLAAVVPRTREVRPDEAQALWAGRRELFFKPMAGFGSRGAYRGDKLTRRVWDEILAGGYVAQELVPPSERAVAVDEQPARLKVDVRAYAYQGRVLLLAARTWQGQTTNFRTPGGGFSPVVIVPDLSSCNCP
jgi:hypothetical protein